MGRFEDGKISEVQQMTPAAETLIAEGNTAENRARLAALIGAAQGDDITGQSGLDDTMEAIRLEMRKFASAEVKPPLFGPRS